MSDDNDIFDFESEIDNSELSSDNDSNQSDNIPTSESEPTTAPKKGSKKSGKRSGKTTGSVTRQQKRVPMHQRQPLNVEGRDPNFEYRIVNDTPGRVDRFKLAGWVPDEATTVGDSRAGKASQMGSVSGAPVGRGTNGIVMKIPKGLYKEDQIAKQKKVDESEELMLEEAAEAVNQAAGGKDEWRGEIKLNRGVAKD